MTNWQSQLQHPSHVYVTGQWGTWDGWDHDFYCSNYAIGRDLFTSTPMYGICGTCFPDGSEGTPAHPEWNFNGGMSGGWIRKTFWFDASVNRLTMRLGHLGSDVPGGRNIKVTVNGTVVFNANDITIYSGLWNFYPANWNPPPVIFDIPFSAASEVDVLIDQWQQPSWSAFRIHFYGISFEDGSLASWDTHW